MDVCCVRAETQTYMMCIRRTKEAERAWEFIYILIFIYLSSAAAAAASAFVLQYTTYTQRHSRICRMVEGTPTKIMRMKSLLSNFITIAAAGFVRGAEWKKYRRRRRRTT